MAIYLPIYLEIFLFMAHWVLHIQEWVSFGLFIVCFTGKSDFDSNSHLTTGMSMIVVYYLYFSLVFFHLIFHKYESGETLDEEIFLTVSSPNTQASTVCEISYRSMKIATPKHNKNELIMQLFKWLMLLAYSHLLYSTFFKNIYDAVRI